MKKNENAGFTIVEMLIAISISSVILLGVFTLSSAQTKIMKTHDQIVETQQNIRSAMFVLERELKIAGYRGNSLGITAGFISPCNSNTLTFTYLADEDGRDNDRDNVQDEAGELARIQYLLFDGDGDGKTEELGRIQDYVPGVQEAADSIAEDIESIEFYYTMADGFQITAPTVAPYNASQIRSVTISLLAKSRKAVKVNTSGHTYTTASGASWTRSNDGIFRRFARSSIICRNLIGVGI